MANQEKNKYQSHILVEQIDQFVAYLEVEKLYASNTISAYQRDLFKFLSFCLENSVTEWKDIEPDTVNLFIMGLRHRGVSARQMEQNGYQKERVNIPSKQLKSKIVEHQ